MTSLIVASPTTSAAVVAEKNALLFESTQFFTVLRKDRFFHSVKSAIGAAIPGDLIYVPFSSSLFPSRSTSFLFLSSLSS